MRTEIVSRAPTRVDLAGGTLDIWPLYLFLPDARTVNLGIDLFAQATITEETGSGKIMLRSDDQKVEAEFKWDALEGATAHPGLILHLKLLRHFARQKGGQYSRDKDFTLSTKAKSPAGAGLGGSSTLSVAMIGALATWARGGKAGSVEPEKEGERLIEVTRDTETTVIQVPAGLQDYYGAMFGGLQSLRWRVGAHERQHLPTDILAELETRLLLFYSGQSRNSGINNWALFKSFIDNQENVRSRFEGISAATVQLEKALRAKDWNGASQAIAEEWKIRRTLAAGISTDEINSAFDIASKESGGTTSGKICGAGGGGCFFVYLPSGDPAMKTRIQEKISALPGIRHLPFRAVPHGLDVKVT